MPNIPLAKKLIAEAADLCVSTTIVADRHADYATRRDTKIKPKSTPIVNSTEALLTDAGREIGEQLKKAEGEAAKHDYAKAHTLLDDVLTRSEKAAALLKADTDYKARLGVVKNGVGLLTTSNPASSDPVIGGDITGTNQSISKAEIEAAKPDYDKAMKLLEEADVARESAAVKKKMKGNVVPTEGELTSLMSKPGGTKLLDQIVAGLGATAQQAVLHLAMKVRFGLDAIKSISSANAGTADTDEVATAVDSDLSLNKIYELFTKVPDKHTKDNPSFAKVKRYKGDPGDLTSKARAKGDYYTSSEKEIVLSVGRPGQYDYTLQDPGELPDVTEGDCKLADDVKPKHFDNNTLHEAAHAIDDKKGFMRRNGSGADYGGWIDHGGDVMPAAKAAASALNYDPMYIAKYLMNEASNPEPPPPTGVDATDWDAARDKAKTWADAIRKSENPWAKGTLCNKNITNGGLAIAGRVYHQAYDDKWVSYLAEKRKQGVTGYQFRAPGEWFAELYAAYGNRKLKAGHPAVRLFLAKMFPLNPPIA